MPFGELIISLFHATLVEFAEELSKLQDHLYMYVFPWGKWSVEPVPCTSLLKVLVTNFNDNQMIQWLKVGLEKAEWGIWQSGEV